MRPVARYVAWALAAAICAVIMYEIRKWSFCCFDIFAACYCLLRGYLNARQNDRLE